MLTIPKEIVPLQIARGALLADLRVGVGARLRAVFGPIPNIKGITIGQLFQLG